jgi:hypothetical protein
MVAFHFNGVLGSQEQRVTTLKSKYYYSEFFVIGIIILFCWLEASTVKCDGVDAIFEFLRYDYT